MQHRLFNVRIDDLDPDVIRKRIDTWLMTEGKPKTIVTPNAEFLLDARKDATFAALLNKADLSVPDSVSLRYAVAALSTANLLFRYPGVDLLQDLITAAQQRNQTILLLGGDPGSAETAAKQIREAQPTTKVIAHDPGIIKLQDNTVRIPEETAHIIDTERPDIVAVALGQHKQEVFMQELAKRFPFIKILIGVGGAFEMIGGQKRRSPLWMRQTGLEWLWRLGIEPQRLHRILNASIVFPVIVAKEAFRARGYAAPLKAVFSEVIKQLRGV